MKLRSIKTSVFALTVSVLASATALAASESAWDGDHSPVGHANNVMDKQVLLQSMTRDACFKMAGVEGKDFGARTSQAVISMERSLNALSQGHDATDHNTLVRDRLGILVMEWGTLSAALQQVSAGDYHAVPVKQVLTLEPLLHDELRSIYGVYASDLEGPQRTNAVLEKKMRIHKLTKEACFILRGISAEQNRGRASATMLDFEQALNTSETFLTTAQRERIQASWQPLKELLQQMLSADQVADETKLELSHLSDRLIEELQQVQ